MEISYVRSEGGIEDAIRDLQPGECLVMTGKSGTQMRGTLKQDGTISLERVSADPTFGDLTWEHASEVVNKSGLMRALLDFRDFNFNEGRPATARINIEWRLGSLSGNTQTTAPTAGLTSHAIPEDEPSSPKELYEQSYEPTKPSRPAPQAISARKVNDTRIFGLALLNDKLICPHCNLRGHVYELDDSRKSGVSGAKATAALLTGGLSLFATGLSRKVSVRSYRCGNCDSRWNVER